MKKRDIKKESRKATSVDQPGRCQKDKKKPGEQNPFPLGEGYLDGQKSKKRKGRSTQQTKKMTRRMISTIQWSVFAMAYPMPVCFAERWGIGEK